MTSLVPARPGIVDRPGRIRHGHALRGCDTADGSDAAVTLRRRMLLPGACLVFGLLGARSQAEQPVRYERIQREAPLPLQIHVLRVDLQAPGISLHVEVGPRPPTGMPGEVLMRNPLELARAAGLDWAINTNPWHYPENPRDFPMQIGAPAMINGWAVSGGETRSRPNVGGWEFWLDAAGRARVGNVDRDEPSLPEVSLGVGGYQGLVRHGQSLQTNPDARRAPRSALGVDREGRILTLVVVDKGVLAGMPGWREVMNPYELADLMIELGCWDAYNLDGGGSSILIRRDATDPDAPRWVALNKQSELFQRPLPMVLGVRLDRSQAE